MTETETRYLVVGGGMTGDAACKGIREHDPDGSITLVGAETHPPYKRPPLTKGLWTGGDEEKIWRGTDRARRRSASRAARSSRSIADARIATDDARRRRTATRSCCSRPAAGRGSCPAAPTGRLLPHARRLPARSARAPTTGARFVVDRRRIHRLGDRRRAGLNGCQVTMVFPDAGICARLFPAELVRLRHRLLPRARASRCSPARRVERAEDGTRADGRRARARGRRRRRRARDRAGDRPRRGDRAARSTTGSSSTSSAAPAGATTCSPRATSPGSRSPRSACAARVEHEDHANTHGQAVGANMAGAGQPYDHLPFFYSDLFDLGYEAVGDLDSRLRSIAYVEGAEPQGRHRLRGRRRIARADSCSGTSGARSDAARDLIRAGEPVDEAALGDLA